LSDLFEEVEEQLRSDRYRTLAFKALPWVLGLGAAALVAALAYWGWQSYRNRAIEKASVTYSQALDALGQGHDDQAAKLWTEVSNSPAKGYKSLALMQLGGLKLQAKDTKAAVSLFDRAAQVAPDDLIGDAARLNSAFAVLDAAPKEAETRLAPLTKEGRPYRVQAQEGLAFARLMAGDEKGARSELATISQSLDAPEGAQQRAKAAMDLIDSGSAKSLPAIARAEAALPPAPTPGEVSPAESPTQSPSQAPGPQ
jgi:hypothetical protein